MFIKSSEQPIKSIVNTVFYSALTLPYTLPLVF